MDVDDNNHGGDGGGGDGNAAGGSSGGRVSALVSEERQRFTVELNPDETTFVSWKKLIKDFNKSIPPPPPPPPPPTTKTMTHPNSSDAPAAVSPPASRAVDPGQPGGEAKDAPPSHRFSAVIEKIERLYVGKQSSDEEGLDDSPDDDEYDTEDSFIDDADLDEYFQVDKSTTKHTGFFINRGKLEGTNEPEPSPNHQPKKRRRKDLKVSPGENDGKLVPSKHAKIVDATIKAVVQTAPLLGNTSSDTGQSLPATGEHYQNGKSRNLKASLEHKKKKPADSKTKFEHSSPSKLQVRDSPSVLREANDLEKQKPAFLQTKDSSSKMKGTNEASVATHQASIKVHKKEKNGPSELPNLNLSGSKQPLQPATTPLSLGKDSSSVRPKGTMLERAIKELEKIVAESRPPTVEVQDTDNSFQAVKRRLPREVKQKLAKVARLAQSSQGKIPEELIQRLMSILGHIVQLRTLKRNLKEMVELGLSAKQEKDNKFQQIKEEVIEMIKKQGPWLKASEQQDGTFDDFREGVNSKEKGVLEGKCTMNDAMEDKICELYDLFVEGMDEDRGPRTRKLYLQLAELWPNGCMDNHGIKKAVYRAKERRRALHSQRKDPEKIKRKKLSASSKTDDTFRGEASSIAQPRLKHEKIVTESNKISTSPNGMASVLISSKHIVTSGRTSISPISGSSLDRPKQEKVNVNSSTFLEEARKTMDGTLVKKKLKRKSGSDFGDIPSCLEKLSHQQEKERQKPNKHASSHSNKSDLQSVDIPKHEQPS